MSSFISYVAALFSTGILLVFVIVAAALSGGCAAKPQETGFLSTYKNLGPVEGSSTSLRYIASADELGRYSSIVVDPITTHFYDETTAEKLKPEDIQHLEQFFYAQLVKDLQAAGFAIVSTPGPGVARLRIAITNLKAGTPALNVIPQTKLTGLGLGQTAAEGEMVDSVSGVQLAAAVKSDTGSRFSFSGLSKWSDVEAVMKDWSKALVERLSEARSKMRVN
jgi:hypothetical protein